MGPLDDDKKPPRPGRRLLFRATIGALLIFICSAATVASAGLLEVDQLIRIVKSESAPIPGIEGALDNVPAGKPQTILVLGSDRRFVDIKEKNPVRSDTMMLVRLDPARGVTAVMSIPRDLKVDIPTGRGIVTDKINAAYALGGPSLSVRVVKNLLHIPISHVVNVNFGGFQRAVNRLGCVYVDVDRDYFNDNHPPNGSPFDYATININPGYQKLCGSNALDYVRYRHFDDDLVRAARQQSFLSAGQGADRARADLRRPQGAPADLRPLHADRHRAPNTPAILRLLKLAFEASKNPIREVHFRGDIGETYVTIGPTNLQRTIDEFRSGHGLERPARDRDERLVQVVVDEPPAGGPHVERAAARRDLLAGRGRELRRRRLDPSAVPDLLPARPAVPRPLPLRPPARVRHLRPRAPALPRVPHRRRHRRAGPVLRHPGHELEGAADPRQPVHDDAHARAHVRAVHGRKPARARGVADAARRLLGVEHAVPHAHEPADARDRPVAEPGRRALSATRPSGRAAARRDAGGPRYSRPPLMTSPREPIGVIGTGYVGLVTAAGFAELGNDVWCIDIDADKIDRLKRGEIPIYEPGLAELVAKHRERLHFSTDIADALEHARLLFVAVGTPPTYSGDADLSAVHAVVDAMPPSDQHALVMKSTVPVGTGESIKRIFAEQGKEGFRYVSCPEFLKEGSAVADFLEPDRVVVGDDGDWAGDAVVELYAPLDAPLVRTDIASAEMIKLAANAFLATKISFINEIANVCEVTGADVIEVAKGIGLDDRIGPKFLQAGVGFGGSCFPKDVSALKQLAGNSGYHFQLLNAVIEVNELQKRRVIGKLEKHLGTLVGKRVALLGLAFKPNTDDMREATSLVLSARLQADGRAGQRLRPGRRGRGAAADARPRLRRRRARLRPTTPTPSCS